jgi:hypothetical protein
VVQTTPRAVLGAKKHRLEGRGTNHAPPACENFHKQVM